MKTTLFGRLGLLFFVLISVNCKPKNETQSEESKLVMNVIPEMPKAQNFVDSPLRNRIKLNLKAPVSEVWNVVGRPERMPEYSMGLNKVEADYSEQKCTGFTCYFHPMEGQNIGLEHKEQVIWYEENIGYISQSEEPNNFGYTDSLALVSVSATEDGTIFTWDIHYNAGDEPTLHLNIDSYAMALDDIANNLIQLFDGKILENFVYGK